MGLVLVGGRAQGWSLFLIPTRGGAFCQVDRDFFIGLPPPLTAPLSLFFNGSAVLSNFV